MWSVKESQLSAAISDEFLEGCLPSDVVPFPPDDALSPADTEPDNQAGCHRPSWSGRRKVEHNWRLAQSIPRLGIRAHASNQGRERRE